MSLPIVVLIGGCPGAGKTTLGRALALRLDAAWLTADDLQSGMMAVTSPESHPGLHAMSRAVTGLSSQEYFTETPVERLIADANAQHEAMWPAINAVIDGRVAEGNRIVIDGWYMRPEKVAALNDAAVKSFWLSVNHPVLEERERSFDFYSSSTDPERMLQNFLARSYWYNDLITEQAQKFGLPVLKQDGTISVDALCDQVLASLSTDV